MVSHPETPDETLFVFPCVSGFKVSKTGGEVQLIGINSRIASQLEYLVRCGHFHAGFLEERREAAHRLLLAVNQEGTLRGSCLPVPGEEFRLVGVGGKSVDRVNGRVYRNLFAEEVDMRGAVDDPSGEAAAGCIADKNYARIRTPEVVLEVIPYPPAGAHA